MSRKGISKPGSPFSALSDAQGKYALDRGAPRGAPGMMFGGRNMGEW